MPRYSALLDSSTDVVLVISEHPAPIVFAGECMLDTTIAFSVQYPNYLQSSFISSLDPENYTKWTWRTRDRTFVETRPDIRTEYIKERSRLAVSKIDIVGKMMNCINIARYKLRTGIQFQETIYFLKKMQAVKFRESGYSKSAMLECPYVAQYAQFANISCQQAADDILLKATMDDEVLQKTELLRLKYFDDVKTAASAEDLAKIYREFLIDCRL
jgi:hypothetical protein